MTTPGSDIETGQTPVALAMDWGGTWARAAVIDRQGAILWQDRVANQPGTTCGWLAYHNFDVGRFRSQV